MPRHDSHQPIFRALSDPTRRAILAMLATGDRAIGDIAAEFDMTRPAVAKHLAILKEGDLIKVEAMGRERINKLNPVALKKARDWLDHFNHFWDDRLAKLKEVVEENK